MSNANTTTLTFTGNTKDIESSFDRVGSSSEGMRRKVDDSADGFDRVGEAADDVDTKAMGFRDTMTGVQDTMLGVSEISKGNLFDGFMALGAGIGDLGSAMYNFLIPSMKSAVGWLKATRLGTIATTVAQKAAAAGAKIWAAAQRLLNFALTANPIGLVVVAIAALVAIFVIAWKHSDTFRRIVTGAWRGIQAAAMAVGRWFRGTLWPWIKGVADRISSAFRSIPGRLRSAFSGLFNILTWPFRSAFNFIATAWNNTVGRLRWTVPGWVPFIGGNSISAPTLPRFHSGGVVPGAPGTEVMAILQAGERVTPRGQDNITITIRSDGSRMADALMEVLDRSVRGRGLALAATRG